MTDIIPKRTLLKGVIHNVSVQAYVQQIELTNTGYSRGRFSSAVAWGRSYWNPGYLTNDNVISFSFRNGDEVEFLAEITSTGANFSVKNFTLNIESIKTYNQIVSPEYGIQYHKIFSTGDNIMIERYEVTTKDGREYVFLPANVGKLRGLYDINGGICPRTGTPLWTNTRGDLLFAD